MNRHKAQWINCLSLRRQTPWQIVCYTQSRSEFYRRLALGYFGRGESVLATIFDGRLLGRI